MSYGRYSILGTQEEIAEHTKEIAGIIPDFDLSKYQEGIQERIRQSEVRKFRY